ncbi:mucin-2-like [Liolophura sinensis]|uniref:mucin-2-like n=1 Tax=Liolophura sinensis TaxID=3198878 RepID=UPI00315879E3
MKGSMGFLLCCVLAVCLLTTTSGMTTQPTVNGTETTPNAEDVANTTSTAKVTPSTAKATTTTTKDTTTTTKVTPPTAMAGASKTTTRGPKIGTVVNETPTPAPTYYYVSTCKPITIECPQKDWTVHVNRVFGGRKLDPTCTADRAECCKAEMDNRTECLIENKVVVNLQREYCLKTPGEPCLIFEHSAHYIGCKDNLVSQYTVVEFYCAYIPIPTRNDTTVITTPSTTAAPSTRNTQPTTTIGRNTSTPKPLPIAIIAGSAGGGVFLIVIIVVIVCCVRMRKQRIMKQDMTKAQLGMNPVSDIGVNYMDAEKGTDRDPDIIKTTPKVANGKPYNSS